MTTMMNGRLQRLTDPTGTINYTYDLNGNLDTVTDSSGTIDRDYDDLYRVHIYKDARGNSIQYDYDDAGNLEYLTYPGGKRVKYEYYDNNLLHRVIDWANRITTYDYNDNGQLLHIYRPNGTKLTLQYNVTGQVYNQKDEDINGNLISEYSYIFNDDGNISTEQASTPQQPFLLSNTNMTYTSDNKLSTFNGQNVVYDADGNMTNGPLAGAMVNYVFDSRNRLTAAGTTTYTYDAENNRIGLNETVNGVVYQTSFVVNPHAALSQTLIKTDAQGKQTFYVYGLGLIGQEETDGSYLTYHFDSRGSTIALTDNNGTVTNRYQYGPYGELVYQSGSSQTPFLYNGRDGVETDSNGLYYMRARYYNPKSKRFVNQDVVLGSIEDGRGLNRYAYVNGNPISNIDPLGLFSCRDNDYELVINQNMIYFKERVGSFWQGINGSIQYSSQKAAEVISDVVTIPNKISDAMIEAIKTPMPALPVVPTLNGVQQGLGTLWEVVSTVYSIPDAVKGANQLINDIQQKVEDKVDNSNSPGSN